MLKRLNRGKERTIGQPTLIETTYDQKAWQSIPHVSEAQGFGSQQQAPSSAAALPPLPFRLLEPEHDGKRISEAPSATSIYSRPSHDYSYGYPAVSSAPAYSMDHQEISPPSSPENYGLRHFAHAQHDVSPVDDRPDSVGMFKPRMQYVSHLPLPKKAASASTTPAYDQQHFGPVHQPKPLSYNTAANRTTRWDDFSGEPTVSESGKYAQVHPGDTLHTPTPTARREVNKEGTNTLKARNASFAERASRFTGMRIVTAPQTREPWKLASGRTAIVDPVADKPEARSIPLRSHRISSAPAVDIPNTAVPPLFSPRSGGPVVTETVSVSSSSADDEEPIKPVVPLKVGRTTPPRIFSSPTSPTNQYSAYPSPISPNIQAPAATTSVPFASKGSATADYGKENVEEERPSAETIRNVHIIKALESQPKSRFSWTTVATATTYQHSPPPSPPPPLPSMPLESATPAPSIMERRRPVPPADRSRAPSIITHRKPVPSIGTASVLSGSPVAHSPVTITPPLSATTKSLPPPPTQVASADLVENLEAQLDDIRHQKANINRLVSDLTKLEPKSPIVMNLAARREVAKKVDAYKQQLDGLTADEHDIGLRLHRAQKRRDKENGGEGTTLWVRRVTS